ncbi:ABC transporter ATP-binding protein/permease [Collinsella sp. AGMB00827]|uniref:ABC transporter ATP-binding protein/permease n=1 Tax=Collinsella ureilytica TaxID=2869515 RepID=A0ABS7MMS0_9ACTN|nr:ABC transporter ATP-binding protein [Collinsella urealyticum]MBY4797720.1 ABC transporter ATP-binding protein/permease [Collinsella urealyticum]
MNPYTSAGSVSTVTASAAGATGRNDTVSSLAPPMSGTDLLRRLIVLIRPRAGLTILALLSALTAVSLALFVPILIGQGIDIIIGAGQVNFTQLMSLLFELAAVVCLVALAQWIQGITLSRLAYGTTCDLRIAVSEKIGRMPLSFIDSHPHGDLMSRVVNDVDLVGDGLLQGLTQLFTGVATIVGTLLFMLSISVPMAVIVVLVTPLSVLAAWLIARLSDRSFAAQQAILGQLGAHVEEYVGNQRLVSAFAFGDRAQAGFNTINAELYDAGEHAQFLSSLSNPGTRFINNLIFAIVAGIGCISVITGKPAVLTVGGVQVFLSYANQYTRPFNEITSVITQIQTALASARRVFSLLDAKEEDPDHASAIEITAPQGRVDLNHVDFSYVKDRPLLQDICVHASAGQRIALVGPTGCGKTTLINLLLRFYEVDAGEILLDGQDIRGLTRRSLRTSFGMVLQDSWLFEGTIHDNIAYGRPGATREEVQEAARRAHADGFINALPEGFDTLIIDDGSSFSQGQRQLLCIARVMLTDPAILLLDEATSSIDTRTELQVQAAFDELMRGRTSFVVAHRLSTIQDADMILVMHEGNIIECGTHEELLARGGFYADLYEAQFASTE